MRLCMFLIFAALVAASQQQNITSLGQIRAAWRKTLNPFWSSCMCQTGAKQDILDGFFERGELSNDPCFKCSLLCWGQGLQVISTSGYFDQKRFTQIVAGVDASIANKCGSIKNDDLCEQTYQMLLCVYGILNGRDPYPVGQKIPLLFSKFLG